MGSLKLKRGFNGGLQSKKNGENGQKRGSWGCHVSVLPSNVNLPPSIFPFFMMKKKIVSVDQGDLWD